MRTAPTLKLTDRLPLSKMWPYFGLGSASLVCAGLFWRAGGVNGLVATLQLAFLMGYGLLAWHRPHLALSLLVALAVFSETQDRSAEYDPLALVEYSLHSSFNTTVGGPPITPLEVGMLVLTALVLWRRMGWPTTLPLPPRLWGAFRLPLLGLLAFMVWGYLWGVVIRRGDPLKGAWEVRALAYLLLFYLLTGLILSDRGRWETFFKLNLTAIGLIGLKVVLRFFLFVGSYESIDDHSFDHENALLYDSFLLFGLAAWLIPHRAKTGGWGRRWWTVYLGLYPFVVLAALLQQRRGGFASLAIGLLVLLAVGLRLQPRRVLVFVSLAVLVGTLYYTAFAGNTDSVLGQPARAIRSVIDPGGRDLASNQYREIEYFNLTETIATQPILGIGFGQEFLFVREMPSLAWWPFWHYTPHNEVLWLWLKLGIVGFGFFWLLFAQILWRGVRLFWEMSGDRLQPAILVALTANVMQLSYAWLDQGYSRPRNLIWLGAVTALLGFWNYKKKSDAPDQPA